MNELYEIILALYECLYNAITHVNWMIVHMRVVTKETKHAISEAVHLAGEESTDDAVCESSVMLENWLRTVRHNLSDMCGTLETMLVWCQHRGFVPLSARDLHNVIDDDDAEEFSHAEHCASRTDTRFEFYYDAALNALKAWARVGRLAYNARKIIARDLKDRVDNYSGMLIAADNVRDLWRLIECVCSDYESILDAVLHIMAWRDAACACKPYPKEIPDYLLTLATSVTDWESIARD